MHVCCSQTANLAPPRKASESEPYMRLKITSCCPSGDYRSSDSLPEKSSDAQYEHHMVLELIKMGHETPEQKARCMPGIRAMFLRIAMLGTPQLRP